MPSLSFSARNLFFHHSNTYIIPLETFVFSNVNHGFKLCFSILPSPHWVFSSCHLSLLLLSFSGRAALQLNPCARQLHGKPSADLQTRPSAHAITTPHHPLLLYPTNTPVGQYFGHGILSLNSILPLYQANTFLSQGDNHTLEILSRSLLLCCMPGLQEVQGAFLSQS